MSKKRLPRLLEALESRLEALTEGLEQVDVTGKGIELVKEIKELHAILQNLQQGETDKANKTPPPLTVIWGGMPSASSSSHKTARGTGRGTSTAKKRRASAKPAPAAGAAPAPQSPPQHKSPTPQENHD